MQPRIPIINNATPLERALFPIQDTLKQYIADACGDLAPQIEERLVGNRVAQDATEAYFRLQRETTEMIN